MPNDINDVQENLQTQVKEDFNNEKKAEDEQDTVSQHKRGKINFTNKYVQLITKTAAIMAITLVMQYLGHFAFPGIGGVIFVGTLVNLCLYVAAVSVGLVGGAVVAIVTPLVAFLTGHMGFPPLIPFIGIANYILVLSVYFTFKISKKPNWVFLIVAIIIASVLKFAAMYFGVLNIAKLLSAIKPPQIAALQINFSWPQLVTALSGGVLAVPVLFGLKKARVI